MIIDATFWVMVSFFAFLGLLVYFKVPKKIKKEIVTQKVASKVINIYQYFFLKYHLQPL